MAFPLFRGQLNSVDLDDVVALADDLMYEAKRKRNAWVGMLGINEAVTSSGIDVDGLEPSSILFRAHKSGRVFQHNADAEVIDFVQAS